MVKIIIKNHEEVARKHSAFADLAATFAPGYLRKRVDEDFARQLRVELIAQGILAEVTVEPNPPATDNSGKSA